MNYRPLPSVIGFVLFECASKQGEEFVFVVPPNYAKSNLKFYVAHVEGQAQVRRTLHGLVDIKQAGDTTNTAHWQNPIPGRMTYKVLTPTYRYLCLSRKDEGLIVVDDVALAAGQSYTVPAGKFGLMLDGSNTILAAGQSYTATAVTKVAEVTL